MGRSQETFNKKEVRNRKEKKRRVARNQKLTREEHANPKNAAPVSKCVSCNVLQSIVAWKYRWCGICKVVCTL